MSDEVRYVTVPQAAQRLQTSEEMVRRMLRDGRLRGRRLGGRAAGWRLAASEIDRFMDAEDDSTHGRPGPRPRRAATAVRSPLDRRLELEHARAEAAWARRDGDKAGAERWERIAADIATRIGGSVE